MTIDEAINIIKSDNKFNKSIGCNISFEEQLAEWLEELKEYRNNVLYRNLHEQDKKIYNKAIDDFVKALLSNPVVDKSVVRRVAEQLKVGGDNVNTSNSKEE